MQNFEAFNTIYLKNLFWREIPPGPQKRFEGVEYYHEDRHFEKLQRFAKSGNIIATLGNIADLKPFHHLPVAAIDISNIQNYELVDLQWPRNVHVIWTTHDRAETDYQSDCVGPISEESRARCKELIDILKETGDLFFNGAHFSYVPSWLLYRSKLKNRLFGGIESCRKSIKKKRVVSPHTTLFFLIDFRRFEPAQKPILELTSV